MYSNQIRPQTLVLTSLTVDREREVSYGTWHHIIHKGTQCWSISRGLSSSQCKILKIALWTFAHLMSQNVITGNSRLESQIQQHLCLTWSFLSLHATPMLGLHNTCFMTVASRYRQNGNRETGAYRYAWSSRILCYYIFISPPLQYRLMDRSIACVVVV